MTPLAAIPSPTQGVWELGPFPVRAYALSIIAGIVAACWIAERLVARTRTVAGDLAVCVGLGVSDADQAAEVAGFADGVIVGSAYVREMLEGRGADGVRALSEELAKGIRS